MKREMRFSHRTGTPIERPGEQLIELPLAISDSEGNPIKGQKAMRLTLESRYKDAKPNVFLRDMPWRPECCMLEGMFRINTTPVGSQKTMLDYAKFLFTRFIQVQFKRGCNEVHVIFDNPGRLQNTPKYFEQLRRDKLSNIQANHCCDIVTSITISAKTMERRSTEL